jgi:hypothetical protein
VNAPPEVPIITAALLGDVKPICPRLDRPDYVPVAQPILAHERVTYVGEPIAAVIGDTAAEAEDLAVIRRAQVLGIQGEGPEAPPKPRDRGSEPPLDMLMTLQGVYEKSLSRRPPSLRRAPR